MTELKHQAEIEESGESNKISCIKCRDLFKRDHLHVKRRMCFRCWYKRNELLFPIEYDDLYIYGTYGAIIIILLKQRGREDLIEKLKEYDNNKDFLRKIYYRLRGLNERKYRAKKLKQLKEQKWSSKTYWDGCPYCHTIVEFNRESFEGFNCKHCKRFLYRSSHPDKEMIFRIWARLPEVVEQIKLKNKW